MVRIELYKLIQVRDIEREANELKHVVSHLSHELKHVVSDFPTTVPRILVTNKHLPTEACGTKKKHERLFLF